MSNSHEITGLAQTAISADSENQLNRATAYTAAELFDWLWDGETGFVAVGQDKAPDKRYRGCRPGEPYSKCPGKGDRWCRGRCDSTFREHYFAWPDKRDDLARWPDFNDDTDIWFAPTLYRESKNPKTSRFEARRRVNNALPTRVAFSDLDHSEDWTPEQRSRIEDFTETYNAAVVGSGSGDNVHIYIRLSRPLDPYRIETLNRRIAAYLGGDASKVDASSLLRFPGTRNLKPSGGPVVLRRLPAADSPRVDPDDLDALLPPAPPREKRTTVGERRDCRFETGHPVVVDRMMPKWLERLQAIEPGDTDKGADAVCNAVAFMGGQWIGGGELNEDYFREWYMSKVPDDVEADHAEWKLDHGIEDGVEEPRNIDEPSKEFDPMAGYLRSGGHCIEHMTTVRVKDGDDVTEKTAARMWMDADLRATGRQADGQGNTLAYVVDVLRLRDRKTIASQVLPLDVLTASAKLEAWLARFDVAVMPEGPSTNVDRRTSDRVRIRRYLAAQNPPTRRVVGHYGWDTQSSLFLTPIGGIRAAELVEFAQSDALPDASIASFATYQYGFVAESEALNVLRAVLTHQDEVVSSVFGAWWVMSLLKGQYQADLFPVVNIEAVKGSGKSRGFFAEMVALSGNCDGAKQYTTATLRDAIASNLNGLVWVDDLTKIKDDLSDIIRSAASGGSRAKKGADNHTTESRSLVSSILVTGEGLGDASNDGALLDRFVSLEILPVKGRRNADGRLQWLDMQELWAKYGGPGATEGALTAVAGSLVQAVLRRTPHLAKMSSFRTSGGRRESNAAVLKTGAHVLADLTGDTGHTDRVARWADSYIGSAEGLESANIAIREIIPWALRMNGGGVPREAKGWVPAFVNEDGHVVVSVEQLATRWSDRNHLSDRQRQLGSKNAIDRELTACETPLGRNETIGGSGPKRDRRRYRTLTVEMSKLVLDEAGVALG